MKFKILASLFLCAVLVATLPTALGKGGITPLLQIAPPNMFDPGRMVRVIKTIRTLSPNQLEGVSKLNYEQIDVINTLTTHEFEVLRSELDEDAFDAFAKFIESLDW